MKNKAILPFFAVIFAVTLSCATTPSKSQSTDSFSVVKIPFRWKDGEEKKPSQSFAELKYELRRSRADGKVLINAYPYKMPDVGFSATPFVLGGDLPTEGKIEDWKSAAGNMLAIIEPAQGHVGVWEFKNLNIKLELEKAAILRLHYIGGSFNDRVRDIADNRKDDEPEGESDLMAQRAVCVKDGSDALLVIPSDDRKDLLVLVRIPGGGL